MPQITIPLANQPSQRNVNAFASISKDARMVSAFVTPVPNNLLKTASVYVEKRSGFSSLATVAAAQNGKAAFYDETNGVYVTSFESGGTETIFTFLDPDVRNCNVVAGSVGRINKTFLNSETHYLIPTQTTRGYYLPYLTLGSTKTFTADTASGSPNLENVSSTNGLYVGQTLSGTGIPATARIRSFSGSTVVMGSDSATAVNATANGTGITVTRSDVSIIMSTSAPTGTRGLVEMDGYVFSATGERIYNSSINDLNTWNAANYVSPVMETDNIIVGGLIRYKQHIVAFGTSSIEFFYNAGNPFGSVLSRRSELYSSLGALFVAQASDLVAFIATDVGSVPGANRCVYVLDGFSPKRISTNTIEKIISQSPPTSIDIGSAFGKTFVHVAAGTTASYNYSLLYCVDSGEWTESGFPFYMRFASAFGLMSGVAQNSTGGKLYTINVSSPVYQDDSSAYTMTLQTEAHALNKGKPFTINSVDLIADNQASGTTTLEYSRDDYANFTNHGTFDMTTARKRLFALGYFDNHVIFRLTHSANTAWRGQALVVDYSPCLH